MLASLDAMETLAKSGNLITTLESTALLNSSGLETKFCTRAAVILFLNHIETVQVIDAD